MLETAITPEAVQAAYDARFDGVPATTEYNASHILVETEETALAVIEEITGGADFAETAQTRSTGPSGPNGGQLGWFGTGAMVPSFEAAVVALEVGGVSAPVQTQFGWHVIILNDTRVKERPTLEEVRGELEEDVRAAAVDARIAELTTEADIDQPDVTDVDPAVLKDLTLVD